MSAATAANGNGCDADEAAAPAVAATDIEKQQPRSPSMLRDSQISIELFGPPVSRRSGRPDHLNSILRRSSVALTSVEAILEEDVESVQGDEEKEEEVPTPLLSPIFTDEDMERPKVTVQQHRRMIRRLSMKAPTDPAKLVRVCLKDVSYHIPVQLDLHSKQTVVNQSICYLTYEFFRRLASLCKKESTPTSERKQYMVKDVSELFVPFTKKTVLRNINLVFEPGKTYLILGPPGSGKTSLLRAIAGRLPNFHRILGQSPKKGQPNVTGRIEYNGVTIEDDPDMILPSIVSFVGQLDVHAPYLTVKETFDFASACREDDNTGTFLGASWVSESENLTIEGLGLSVCENTFVGSSDVRGISGGQRRRVTIGEMMQGQNPLACADEISTGLDAAVTYDIVNSIVEYSKAVKTTRVVSLLQPGPETFALFDEVIVLSEGYAVYAGPLEPLVDYFDNLGYALPATMDVADFLQSVTTPDGAMLFDPTRSPRDEHYTSAEFAEAFAESELGKAIQNKLGASSLHDWVKSGVPAQFKKVFKNSWYRSFQLIFRRHLLIWWRDKSYIIGKIGENVGMALTTGGILFGRAKIPDSLLDGDYTESDADELQELQSAVYSGLFMACLHILLGTTTSTPDDVDGRPIHYKQGDANFYHTTAFIFARLASTLPMRAIEIVAFGIPLYWMLGLDPTAKSFFLYLSIMLTYTFALKVLYGIIAQILPNKQNVLSFGTFLVLLFSLFSGFIVYPSVIPDYYIWLYYSNPVAWAFQALLLTEFTSEKYPEGLGVVDIAMGSRGFETSRSWIGLGFAFLVPYIFFWSGILALVLIYVRIEPKRSGGERKTAIAEEPKKEEDFNLPFVPVCLSFEDVVYEVKASTTGETLRILNGVSGALKPGRMCALMGSSGAGKTTLMDVVALRKASGSIEGDFRMNGFPQERTPFLRSSGYVEQFDVQQAELTVRETVVFSAQLRLSRDNPITATEEGRLRFVDYVLETMELTDIEMLQVGSYEEGGLTFEQRKRLAIAVELAASPSVIFLDEPTSGLDARGALVIMRAMKKIAETGRTVCATIHQPSAAVFEMFDDLLLLKRGGEVVFFGELGDESCNLVEYFEERGAEPIEHGENPAAWMFRAYARPDNETDWKESFKQSPQFRALNETLDALKESPDESKRIQCDTVFATSRGTQNVLMIRRVLKIMARAPSYNLARLMIAVIYSILLGTVFLRTKYADKEFYQNEVDGILSTIFLGLIILGVVSVSMAVPMMKQIRDVFYKHRASGMIDHTAVTLAVTIGEMPYILMISAIFSSVYYSLVGLFGTADKWISFFFFFALNLATYTYFGQAFICLVKDVNTAGALVGALIGFNVFFSGLVVQPQYLTGPFQLGYWTAPGRYAYEGIITSQFLDLPYKVIAEPLGPFYYSLGCADPDVECSGTMEEYVDFFFGGRFKARYSGLDIGVLFFCLFLARLLLWLALWKLNYVNT